MIHFKLQAKHKPVFSKTDVLANIARKLVLLTGRKAKLSNSNTGTTSQVAMNSLQQSQ